MMRTLALFCRKLVRVVAAGSSYTGRWSIQRTCTGPVKFRLSTC